MTNCADCEQFLRERVIGRLRNSMRPHVSSKVCVECGSTLDIEAPSGFCPACLLTTALKDYGNGRDECRPGGTRIEDYEIISEVARGGMGIVYRARQRMPSRVVALKMILPSQMGSPGAIARFKAEAEAVASLDHEGILPIYAVGEKDGAPFYSVKFAEGGNLSARIAEFVRAPRESGVLIAALARAIGHAHERGILHRDLKPGNVLFDAGDKPFVSDFGLAKQVEREGDLTQTLAILGTPFYMAPEQAADSHSLTAAADIYSLGAILFHLLTGSPPFRGDNAMEILRNAAERAVPRPRSFNRQVPADLETICLKCLEKNSASRYPSAAALADDLDRFVTGRTISARPAGATTHIRRWVKRNPTVAGLSAVAALLVVSLLMLLSNRADIKEARRSIAVLPFEDLSGDVENASFVGGIQDDVVTNLSKISQLKVISRSSVLIYKATPHNVREIAKNLGVSNVLEGSVRRAGSRVRINVQLIDAADDEQVWAEAYERDVTDAFAIQSDVALQIASKLRANLSAKQATQLQEKPTRSGEAYLLYIEANDIFSGYEKLQPDLEKAEKLYEKAIALDASFALAFAKLSQLETIYHDMYDPVPARLAKAKAAADEAMRLQPALPEAHMALGRYYWQGDAVDYEKALTEYIVAQRGLPNSAEIYSVVGRIERSQRKWPEAIAHLEKAASLDPNNLERWHRLYWFYAQTKNFPAAIERFDHVLALAPDSWRYRLHKATLELIAKGDLRPMEAMLTRPRTKLDGPLTISRFRIELLLRKYDDAEKILLDDLGETFSMGGLQPIPKSFFLGKVCLARGQQAAARDRFEAARPSIEHSTQEHSKNGNWHLLLAETYVGLGRKDDAIREAKRANEITPDLDNELVELGTFDGLAGVYGAVNEPELALPIIAHSLDTPGGVFARLLRLDQVWDPLRRDPRFRQLLKAHGVNEAVD